MYKILVLDDNTDIIALVKIILTREHMDVEVSNQPAMIENTIEKFFPDLLLMDISMPPYDGRDICRKLKTENPKAFSIVLFSANKITHESLKESMADDFIAKPFEMNELITKIKICIENKMIA